MMRRGTLAAAMVVAAGACAGLASAQQAPAAGMLRYPDVSASHIVFVYANDLWLVPRAGGEARPLASPAGQELFPRFSPDGKSIVFQGNYDGGRDLYTIGVDGGVPFRVTHMPISETPTDWHAERGVVFHANGMNGVGRAQNIFTIPAKGGMFETLDVPYGANGAVSDDGQWLAYTPTQRDFRTWKRYVGGLASDIWLFNLNTQESRKITDWEGTDTLPMWHGGKVYYLSDAGPQQKLNIWSYEVSSGRREQVTTFDAFDVKFPAIGPGENGRGEIVLQNGTGLYLVDLASKGVREVKITVPGAKPRLRERIVDASDAMAGGRISATGKRAVVEARGDIWTIPAENGPPRQITDTSGAAERSPAWSPDGRWIAYFADTDGEYNVYVTQSDGKGDTRKLTDVSGLYFMSSHWSPDSKHLLATDQTGRMHLVDIAEGGVTEMDREPWANDPDVSWSADSRWVAYTKGNEESSVSEIWIYDTQEKISRKVTSGFFNDSSPAFSREGDFLYYASSREFSAPEYGDVGSTFIYGDTQMLIAVPLNAEVENPWQMEVDEEAWDDEADDEADGEADEAEDTEKDDENGDADADDADVSPIQGTWEATAKGLAQLGLPDDEIGFTMYLVVTEDGSVIGASTTMGETSDYDGVTFDADTGAFTASSSEGPMQTELKGTLKGGALSGTWRIFGAGQEANGTWTAERAGEEVPDGKIEAADGKGGKKKGEAEPVEIDFDGFEARGVALPVDRGNFSGLVSNEKGQLIYNRGGDVPSIKLVDAGDDEPEEKTVLNGASLIDISGDGKKLMVGGAAGYGVVDASAGQTLSDPVSIKGLHKTLDPKAEWKQLVTDAWRRFRDFFYVDNMHGVAWDDVGERYIAMVDDAASREDISFIIGEMIGELNVGHAYYRGGGDTEDQPSENVGLLGVDFELASAKADDGTGVSAYRVKKIHEGAAYDTDARNPLTMFGRDIKEGAYLLRVNGATVDPAKDPYAAFIGTAGKPTILTFADALVGDDEARNERDIVLEPHGGGTEQGLRYRAWITHNREYVAERSSGRIGYIHVPNTGVDGQNELFRQFYGQVGMDALIIDERWNGGGQIPNRFIELLDRPRTNYWYRRHGKDWPWPFDSHQGPKAMLINGSAGSGGDMFPWLFREHGIGKLIGTRTWGGLVGISGVPSLIDGANISVPNFGFYETDGTWGIEGHGVDPDIEVVDDPTAMAKGTDPQLDAAVEQLLGEIERNGYKRPARPRPPVRTGIGITDEDK